MWHRNAIRDDDVGTRVLDEDGRGHEGDSDDGFYIDRGDRVEVPSHA